MTRFASGPSDQDSLILGLVSDAIAYSKFGFREGLSSGAGPQTVWSKDDEEFSVMTTADTFDIAYGGSDGLGTQGALELTIDYLDSSFQLQTATHTLGSSGLDTTAFTGLGINRVLVSSAGTTTHNVAAITITDTSAASSTQAYIPAEYSVTHQLIFHCPSGYTPILKQLIHSVQKLSGSDPKVAFVTNAYNRASGVSRVLTIDTMDASANTHIEATESVGFRLLATDVVYLTADTTVNATNVSARFTLTLYGD